MRVRGEVGNQEDGVHLEHRALRGGGTAEAGNDAADTEHVIRHIEVGGGEDTHGLAGRGRGKPSAVDCAAGRGVRQGGERELYSALLGYTGT